MAVLFVTEFARLGRASDGYLVNAPEEPPLAQQTVAIGGASVQSAAFNASTRLIRVQSDATCSIEIGANPTATTTSRRVAANQPAELIGVPASGGPFKVAVITNV